MRIDTRVATTDQLTYL